MLLAASDGLGRLIFRLQQQQLLSALKAIWSSTAGVLLAASDGLERSIFRRSVVLVYEHGNRNGARGVILSQPLGPTDPRFNPAATPGGLPALSHFLGGPVGMPGAPLLFHCAAPCLMLSAEPMAHNPLSLCKGHVCLLHRHSQDSPAFCAQAAQCCRQAVMSGITKCRLSRELQRTAWA